MPYMNNIDSDNEKEWKGVELNVQDMREGVPMHHFLRVTIKSQIYDGIIVYTQEFENSDVSEYDMLFAALAPLKEDGHLDFNVVEFDILVKQNDIEDIEEVENTLFVLEDVSPDNQKLYELARAHSMIRLRIPETI